MSKKYNYSDITSMAGQLKLISSQISDILNELQNEQYSHIGDNGDIWTGDIANTSKQTFEDLTTRLPKFVESINEYADYLVKDVAQR